MLCTTPSEKSLHQRRAIGAQMNLAQVDIPTQSTRKLRHKLSKLTIWSSTLLLSLDADLFPHSVK
jgi:hypothetical protein